MLLPTLEKLETILNQYEFDKNKFISAVQHPDFNHLVRPALNELAINWLTMDEFTQLKRLAPDGTTDKVCGNLSYSLEYHLAICNNILSEEFAAELLWNLHKNRPSKYRGAFIYRKYKYRAGLEVIATKVITLSKSV